MGIVARSGILNSSIHLRRDRHKKSRPRQMARATSNEGHYRRKIPVSVFQDNHLFNREHLFLIQQIYLINATGQV